VDTDLTEPSARAANILIAALSVLNGGMSAFGQTGKTTIGRLRAIVSEQNCCYSLSSAQRVQLDGAKTVLSAPALPGLTRLYLELPLQWETF